jgi:hypothetical protein
MIKIVFDTSSFDELVELLIVRLGRNIFAAPQAEITQIVRDYFGQRLESRGNGAWPDLSEEYQREHPDALVGNPGGSMWTSLTSDSPDSVNELTDTGLRLGSQEDHIAFFDAGTSRGQPPRPILGDPPLPDDVVQKVLDAIATVALAP